jgi:hypothetical protein
MARFAAYPARATLLDNNFGIDFFPIIFHTLDSILELDRIADRELIRRLEILETGKELQQFM